MIVDNQDDCEALASVGLRSLSLGNFAEATPATVDEAIGRAVVAGLMPPPQTAMTFICWRNSGPHTRAAAEGIADAFKVAALFKRSFVCLPGPCWATFREMVAEAKRQRMGAKEILGNMTLSKANRSPGYVPCRHR